MPAMPGLAQFTFSNSDCTEHHDERVRVTVTVKVTTVQDHDSKYTNNHQPGNRARYRAKFTRLLAAVPRVTVGGAGHPSSGIGGPARPKVWRVHSADASRHEGMERESAKAKSIRQDHRRAPPRRPLRARRPLPRPCSPPAPRAGRAPACTGGIPAAAGGKWDLILGASLWSLARHGAALP